VYEFPSLGTGDYTVVLEGPEGLSEEVAVMTEVVTPSAVRCNLLAIDPVVRQGSMAVLSAFVFEDSAPVPGAGVLVSLKPPQSNELTLVLLDDGADADNAIGDGIYSAMFEATELGDYIAVADIVGITSELVPFQRVATARVQVVAPSATFASTTFTDQGVDTNGNGLYDRVAVTAPVTVVTAGDYILTIFLQTALGKTFTAYGYGTLAVGAQTMTAYAEALAILATNENGPYTIREAELLYVSAGGAVPAGRMEGGTQQTNPYLLSQFERPPIRLTGVNTDGCCVDLGPDGDCDILCVHLGIEVAASGTFYYAVELQDACRRQIAWANADQDLLAGPAETLDLSFSGSQIGAHGVDGPYVVANLYLYGTCGNFTAASVHQTQAYSAQQFDGYAPFADCNGNAVPDSCDITALSSVDCDMNGQPDECQTAPGTNTPPEWRTLGVRRR
jgi:hypothetical protein